MYLNNDEQSQNAEIAYFKKTVTVFWLYRATSLLRFVLSRGGALSLRFRVVESGLRFMARVMRHRQ